MAEDQWLPDLFKPKAPESEPEDPMSAAGRDIEKPTEGLIVPDEEPTEEPATQPTSPAPYDTIDVALDGWEYRLFTEWLGKDEMEQKKNVDIFLDILHKYDPSATANVEKSKKHPGSSWVFRFGLYGDPGDVTEAIENTDSQLLSMASNWEVQPGTAKALVKRMDGIEEAVELPKDMVSRDIATTMYRLLDLVQTGDGKLSPDTESRTSELRQMTSPASGEYCTEHGKTGEEHTDEEREADILGAKGESAPSEVYKGRCSNCKRGDHCFGDCGCGCKSLIFDYDTRKSMEGLYPKKEAHGHPCSECGTEKVPVDEAHTQYRCPNWKGGCSQADTGVPAQDCEQCWKNYSKRGEESGDEREIESEIEYLQWQIGNLDTALEELDNSASSRLIDLEGQHPDKWSPDYQHTPKALMDEEEGRWDEWAEQFKMNMGHWEDAMATVSKFSQWQNATPEEAIKALENAKVMVGNTRRWITETAQLVDVEPVGENDKDIADDLKDLFKDQSTLDALDHLFSTIDKVIAEKQTMAISR